jgi:ankyrin repeat protein
MTNNVSNSPLVAFSTPTGTGTSAPPASTGGQPVLSSRDQTTPSLLPPVLSLHSAAKRDDVAAVLDAFCADRDAIDAIDPETGLTPLETALSGNHGKAAETLIDLGARVHTVTPQSRPELVSLHAASELGDPELLRKVLALSSRDIDTHDPVSGLTPLAFALRGKHLGAARMLLEAGAKPGVANRDGSIPLNSARDADAVRLLLDHGALIDQKDSRDRTALQQAVRLCRVEIVSLLLSRGANRDQVDRDLETVLFVAVSMCEPAIVTLLLDHGLSTEHANRYGYTPLCHAASVGRVDAGKILLARGADRKHASSLSGTPLMIAAEHGELAFLKLLLPAERDLLDTKDSVGNTALHLAARRGHDSAVQALIESGADLGLTNERGNTPLELAATCGRIRTMALLLDAEPDLMQAAKHAQGILDFAVKKGKVPVLEFLLQRGVDINDKTRKLAKTPLIAEMLLHAGLLKAGQVMETGDAVHEPLDGSRLFDKLLDTAVRNKNAGSWITYLNKQYVSPTLSVRLESAAADARLVWKSLAGDSRKITTAQQGNWCAGILADLANVMLREAPYSASGLAPATRAVLENIAEAQTLAMAAAAAAAEQPLREGMANLLQVCMKSVPGGQFYPMDLYKTLTAEHGICHSVASLIVAAFSDVWPRRSSLDDARLAQAFAEKLSSLRKSGKALQSMNHDTAAAGNQSTVNMLMFRQLDLLQAWIDKWLG